MMITDGFNPLVVGAIYEICNEETAIVKMMCIVSIPLWSGQYMKCSIQRLRITDRLSGGFNPLVVGAIYEI